MENFWNGHPEVRLIGDTMPKGELGALPYPESTPAIDDAIKAMYTQGYVVFPGVLNPDEVTLMRARIDQMGSQNDADYVVPGWCYNKQVSSEFHRNPDLLDYIDRPGVIDVAEAVLSSKDGGPCHIVFGSSWVTGAGRAMGLHVDYMPLELPEAVHNDPTVHVPIFMATAHYYLDDMIPELGPTMVVPGSHRAGRPPKDETDWNGVEAQMALVRAGDVVLFRSDLWHGAVMNSHPTKRRYIMQVAYASGRIYKVYPSLKFAASYSGLYTPEVLERLTPRQAQLLT